MERLEVKGNSTVEKRDLNSMRAKEELSNEWERSLDRGMKRDWEHRRSCRPGTDW